MFVHCTFLKPPLRPLLDKSLFRIKVKGKKFTSIPKVNFNKWGMTSDMTGSHTTFSVSIDDLIPLLKAKTVYMRIDLEG